MFSGSDIAQFLIEQVVEEFIKFILPGVGNVIVGIYEFLGLAVKIHELIEKIKYAHSLPGMVLSMFELCVLAAIPILIIVIIFNVVVRLLRRSKTRKSAAEH